MGLYESELSRQIHLRNRQKKEWQAIRKKMENDAAEASNNSKNLVPQHVEKQFQEDKRREDNQEMEETVRSKQLASAMMKSANSNHDDTLQKCVEVMNNQNGKPKIPNELHSLLYSK